MRRHHRILASSQRNIRAPDVAAHFTVQALVFVLALSVGLLGATTACRAGNPANPETNSAEENMEQPADITIDLDSTEKGPPPRVKIIRIKRGEVAQINCQSNTVWIVIPSRFFSKVSGGSDWAIGEDMIAVKIDRGFARVKLSEDFPPSSEETTIYYSILYSDGEEFFYQEGESPPRMIIPPSSTP